jgi:hypothetical protein
MIKDVLQSIASVEIYPIIALVLFITAFIAVAVQTLFMDKTELARISRLPLDDTEKVGEQIKSSGE